jgi:Mor family transcriptional regulator
MTEALNRARQFVQTSVPLVQGRLVAILGIDEAQAVDIARECVHDICVEHGGKWMYIAKDDIFELTKRDRQIFDNYNGRNMQQMVEKYRVTHVRILQIVSQVKKEEIAKRQGRLPGFAN